MEGDVPRLVWHGAQDFTAVKWARGTVNSWISRFVRAHSGIGIRHTLLEGVNSGLMSPDGVHLNDIGTDIYIAGLQEGIQQALALLGGVRPPLIGVQGCPW